MKYNITKRIVLASVVIFVLVGIIGLILWYSNDFQIHDLSSMSAANRSINTYFAAIITSMALIITLTSNLYSPHLAKLFVTHPATICSISFILITNFTITITHIIAPNHILFNIMAFASLTLTVTATFLILPILFMISQFIRPSYFIAVLASNAIEDITELSKRNIDLSKRKKAVRHLFDDIDVLINMSSTAIARKDKSVIKLIIKELFSIARALIIQKNDKESSKWRKYDFIFTNGISDEGKYHLKKNMTWPETYILSKILDISKQLNNTENDLMTIICREMTTANDLAISKNDTDIINLNISILNSMLGESIQSGNSSKYNSISYYYRMNIELLIDNHELCQYAIKSFMFYGNKTIKCKSNKFSKSFLFDLGRIIHYISFDDEGFAHFIYNTYIQKSWSRFTVLNNKKSLYAKKSIIKTFWILYSQNYYKLTSKIKEDFLMDNIEHAKLLTEMMNNHRQLDYEFSDTLVSLETLSGVSYNLAMDFLSDFPEEALASA